MIDQLIRCAILALSLTLSTAQALTINDDTGHNLTLAAPAKRLVSLSPAITENLFAIGAGSLIVGTSSFSNYPAAASQIAITSDYQSVDIERIASLHPDVIIAWQGGTSPAQIAAIERLGIPIFYHSTQTLADIPTALMRLAQLTATETAAAPIIMQLYRDIGLLSEAPKPQLDTFFQLWAHPLMTFGSSSWVSDALARCGARNIFSDITLPAPTVNIEDVLNRSPQIIATTSKNGTPDTSLDAWFNWTNLPAVRHHAYVFTDTDAMSRNTPRTLIATTKMCADIAAFRSQYAAQQ